MTQRVRGRKLLAGLALGRAIATKPLDSPSLYQVHREAAPAAGDGSCHGQSDRPTEATFFLGLTSPILSRTEL